jgi:antitoxin YefM
VKVQYPVIPAEAGILPDGTDTRELALETSLRWDDGNIDIVQQLVHMSHMLMENFTKARANLKALMDRVVADKVPVKITRQNGEAVVMVSESEWAGMEETIHLLSSPENARRLMEAIRGLDAGEGEEHELIHS